VQRALEDAGRGKVWILAVDYPLITPEILRDLRLRFERSAASMLIPKWNDRMQMLCAGYSAELLPRIAERIRSGQIDLRGLATADATEIIEEEHLRRMYAGEPLMNVNTPEELEAARRIDGQGKA
jgi:molybdopterin-guanine dinucleotide biosynthesis protein A